MGFRRRGPCTGPSSHRAREPPARGTRRPPVGPLRNRSPWGIARCVEGRTSTTRRAKGPAPQPACRALGCPSGLLLARGPANPWGDRLDRLNVIVLGRRLGFGPSLGFGPRTTSRKRGVCHRLRRSVIRPPEVRGPARLLEVVVLLVVRRTVALRADWVGAPDDGAALASRRRLDGSLLGWLGLRPSWAPLGLSLRSRGLCLRSWSLSLRSGGLPDGDGDLNIIAKGSQVRSHLTRCTADS